MARLKSSLHINKHGSSQTVDRRVIMGLLAPVVLLISLAPIASAAEPYVYKDLSVFMDALRDNELLRKDVVRAQTDATAPMIVIKRAKVYNVSLVKRWKGYVTVMTYSAEGKTINFGIVRVAQVKEFSPWMPFIKGLKRDDEVGILGQVHDYSSKPDLAGHPIHGAYFTGMVIHPSEP